MPVIVRDGFEIVAIEFVALALRFDVAVVESIVHVAVLHTIEQSQGWA